MFSAPQWFVLITKLRGGEQTSLHKLRNYVMVISGISVHKCIYQYV